MLYNNTLGFTNFSLELNSSSSYCSEHPLMVRKYVHSSVLYYNRLLLFPLQFLIGSSTNFLNFVVLTSAEMRTKTNTFLAAMALADLLFFITMFPLTFSSFQIGQTLSYMRFYFYSHIPIVAFSNSFSAASIWLTVGVTVERVIAVRFPLHARSYLTRNRVVGAIILIFAGAFLINVYHFSMRHVAVAPMDQPNCTVNCTNACSYFFKMIQKEDQPGLYNLFQASIYLAAILMIMLPFIIILALNCVLLSFLRKHHHEMVGKRTSDSKHDSFKHSSDASQREQQNELKVTWTVIVIVLAFLALNVPSAVLMSFDTVTNFNHRSLGFLEGIEISNLLTATGKLINFFLYCFASSGFRQRLLKFLCRGNRFYLKMNRERQFLSRTSLTSFVQMDSCSTRAVELCVPTNSALYSCSGAGPSRPCSLRPNQNGNGPTGAIKVSGYTTLDAGCGSPRFQRLVFGSKLTQRPMTTTTTLTENGNTPNPQNGALAVTGYSPSSSAASIIDRKKKQTKKVSGSSENTGEEDILLLN